MSIKAFFVDFYGTIVHEDGEVIKKITKIICDTGKVENPSEVDSFWWKDFQTMFMNSFGESFETQRALEERSLVHTLERFGSDVHNNFTNYSNEEYDATLAEALACADDAEQTAKFKECETILTDQAANVYIQDGASFVAMAKDLDGFEFYPLYVLDLSKIYKVQ